jgi:hypothetical protein
MECLLTISSNALLNNRGVTKINSYIDALYEPHIAINCFPPYAENLIMHTY